MKVYSIPSDKTDLSIFLDLDRTLYTHDEYAQSQIDLPIKRLADLKGKSFEQMKADVDEYREKWSASNNGKAISLGNTFVEFGVSIKENIRWREEICQPEKYLKEDKQLHVVLKELASRFSLAVITNNPVSVAVRTLTVLGVHDILQNIVGLDTLNISKPHKFIFMEAARLCGSPMRRCVSVGDRYDIDVALPLELGMGGILVDGVEDVYKLPSQF